MFLSWSVYWFVSFFSLCAWFLSHMAYARLYFDCTPLSFRTSMKSFSAVELRFTHLHVYFICSFFYGPAQACNNDLFVFLWFFFTANETEEVPSDVAATDSTAQDTNVSSTQPETAVPDPASNSAPQSNSESASDTQEKQSSQSDSGQPNGETSSQQS